MIDWQVQVNGRDPPGWDRERDGCWFPDFDHQECLLPFFDVGGPPIDPYDGAAFEQADLHRLRAHLRYHRGGFEAKPDAWSITEKMGNQSRTIRLEREKILRCIDKTLHMIEVALAAGGTIVFYGD